MQAIYRKIDSSDEFSFVARIDVFPHLYDKWHFHPELELTHILQSKGTRFVGDHIEEFNEGDLVLLGAYLPHVWKNDQSYFTPDSTLRVTAQVLQFLPGCMGKEFMGLKEMESSKRLFQKAERGLKITGATREKIVMLLEQLLNNTNGLQRIRLFLEILELITASEEVTFLSSEGFLQSYHHSDTGTINRIYEFTLSQFSRKILLEEVATLANMSVATFCRYFKSRTQKTYVEFLTEVRIGFACRMLIENKKSIQQIAFNCGFTNLSNFNRSFRLLKKQTPMQYRQVFARI